MKSLIAGILALGISHSAFAVSSIELKAGTRNVLVRAQQDTLVSCEAENTRLDRCTVISSGNESALTISRLPMTEVLARGKFQDIIKLYREAVESGLCR